VRRSRGRAISGPSPCWGPGRLAGVTADNEVLWWRVVGVRFEPFAPTQRLPYPSRAVAMFARPPVGEVVVLFEDGTAVRLPIAK
jgi:hypothetical protein